MVSRRFITTLRGNDRQQALRIRNRATHEDHRSSSCNNTLLDVAAHREQTSAHAWLLLLSVCGRMCEPAVSVDRDG
jgi:hypothetical protein